MFQVTPRAQGAVAVLLDNEQAWALVRYLEEAAEGFSDALDADEQHPCDDDGYREGLQAKHDQSWEWARQVERWAIAGGGVRTE